MKGKRAEWSGPQGKQASAGAGRVFWEGTKLLRHTSSENKKTENIQFGKRKKEKG